MRWYVNRAGETGGPFEEADVRTAAAQPAIAGAMVRDEAGGTWMPIEESPFRPFLPKKLRSRPRRTSVGTIVLGVIAVLLLAAMVLVSFVRDYIAASKSNRMDSLSMFKESASTNAEASHVTLTNLFTWPMTTCFQGIVTSVKTRTEVKSVPICTGEVKPKSSVVLEAPYPVGAVMEMCRDEKQTVYKSIDWDRCTFDLVEVN